MALCQITERRARLLLHLMPGIGALRARRLLGRYGSAQKTFEAPFEDWLEAWEGPALSLENICAAFQSALARLPREEDQLKRFGADFVVAGDPDFPEILESLPDAPLALSVWGRLARDAAAVGLVGARRPTSYGRSVAERLARELSRRGLVIASGLARGIDTAAHEAVVKAGGTTWGVLGSGFGRLYPPENRRLMEKMAERGAVISEFSFETPPERGHFPVRNRLISGLSKGVAVIEAARQSGALITARWAADQGREVFAVPGPIFSELSAGPHELLKAGAHVAATAEDILDNIPGFAAVPSPGNSEELPAGLSVSEEQVLGKIDWAGAGFDALLNETGLDAGALASTLAALELKGLIRTLPGAQFIREERLFLDTQKKDGQ